MHSAKSVVPQYVKLCEQFNDISTKLTNLCNIKDSIDPERFGQQEKEYKKQLKELEPRINELEEIISSAILELKEEMQGLSNEINDQKNRIHQEDKLLEAGAISREKYRSITKPLKKELEQLEHDAKKLTDSIRYLEKGLMSCSGERGQTTDNDSVYDACAERVSPVYYSKSNRKPVVYSVYVSYLLGLLIWFLPIIGVIVAYVFKDEADEVLQTHYRFQIRTFWIWMLCSLVAILLFIVFVGWLVAIFVLIWLLVRCIFGLKCLYEDRPIPDPASWLFGK